MFRLSHFLGKISPSSREIFLYRTNASSSNSTYHNLNKRRSLLIVAAGSVIVYAGGSLLFGDEQFYREYAMPAVHRLLDGEDAHKLAVAMAAWNLVPLNLRKEEFPALETSVFGRRFATPLGLAAGFDKDGEAVAGIGKMGFTFVEVGSVTPLPQEGNPKPRVFRLPADEAVINRYGFNSAGHEIVFNRLTDFRRQSTDISESSPTSSLITSTTSYTRNTLPEVIVKNRSKPNCIDDERNSLNVNFPSSAESQIASSPSSSSPSSPVILGVNLGKNKTSPSPIGDYVLGVEKFAPLADYLVVNVSSPNTPGLRDMQGKATLEALLDAVLDKLKKSFPVGIRQRPPPLLVKIAPDLTDDDLEDVVQVLLDRSGSEGVAGVIISNTTISRPSTLQHEDTAKEVGGLSGKPLKDLSTKMIKRLYQSSGGKIPIVGCGGISTGADAYEKIRAGASLVQIYSALVFNGPPVVKTITRELNQLLLADGFKSIEEAVGVDACQVDLTAIRNFMTEMVLEKFSKAEEESKEEEILKVEAPEELVNALEEQQTAESSDESKNVLMAQYYNIPSSHVKSKKELPSVS